MLKGIVMHPERYCGQVATQVKGNHPRPVLFLDIDGVLNPYAAPDCPHGYRELVLFEGETEQPIRVSDAHGGWLGELASVFDVVWASGWVRMPTD